MAILLTFFGLVVSLGETQTVAAMPVASENLPEWLEPRGLNVVDLVGFVPEDHLKGAVVAYSQIGGIIQYLEGSRVADEVTIRVQVWPRYGLQDNTMFSCMGQRAFSDHWASAVPESNMRIYSGDSEVTDRIFGIIYTPSGQIQPSGPATTARYAERSMVMPFTEDGAAIVPANMGCTLFIYGRYENLEAEFRFQVEPHISVQYLARERFRFQSYIGVGFSGRLQALQTQLQAEHDDRHDRFTLKPPPGANYILVTFPPSPVTANPLDDVDANIRLPSTGTYRLSSGGAALSVDHNVTMGIPLYLQWRDADQAGDEYLLLLPGIDVITSLEYFVPDGIAYDPCMQYGECPAELMDAITAARMRMSVYYYRIERLNHSLERIPLRQVGINWDPPQHVDLAGESMQDIVQQTLELPQGFKVFLPHVIGEPFPPIEVAEECPCGWFTADGRMFDYTMGLPPPLDPLPTQ